MAISAKILLLDIETAPILGYVWGLWENNLALNQIKSDWHLLSWSAKWFREPASKVFYMDQRNAKNIEDDSKILKEVWKLLDEADVLITQNGKAFDEKKLNARFILNGMKPPSSYKHIDTRLIAKKKFAFTSTKLEYMSEKLCTKFKKLKHKKFPGFELWTECLKGNKKAWNEMKLYNIHDVLTLEELYEKFIAWDNSINFSVFSESNEHKCNCGASDFMSYGYRYTPAAKYKRLICRACGRETRFAVNEFSKAKRNSLQRS